MEALVRSYGKGLTAVFGGFVALWIILMIIVQLLNIVFWWLPFFKICLPIPLKK